jgi:hypothetical protein
MIKKSEMNLHAQWFGKAVRMVQEDLGLSKWQAPIPSFAPNRPS